MSSTDTSIAAATVIYDNLAIFMKCWGFFAFTLGVVGHSLSIYTFTRPALRSNPCIRYFLASTLAGYCVVLVTVPMRTVEIGYWIDLFVTSLGACKFLTYLLSCTRYYKPKWRLWTRNKSYFVLFLEHWCRGLFFLLVLIGEYKEN